MRVVNAEFKNIQAGLWETLNSHAPSGAAADLANVDFPSVGGVRKRGGLQLKFDRLLPGIPDQVPYARDPSTGKRYLRTGDVFTRTNEGAVEDGSGATPGSFPPAIQLVPFVDDIAALHSRPLEVTVQEKQASPVGYVHLRNVTDNTTYTVSVTIGGQTYTATHTLPARETLQPKLDISHISVNDGVVKQEKNVVIIPGGSPTWEPDPQFPDELMTTRALPYQNEIVELLQTSPKGAGNADPHLRRNFSAQGQTDGVTDGGKLKSNELAGLDNNFPGGDKWPRWRPVVPITDTNLWHHAHEFDYWYSARPVNPAFNALVQEAQVKYQKALAEFTAQWATRSSQATVTAELSTALKTALQGTGAIVEVVGGNSLRISHGSLEGISGADNRTGTSFRSVFKTVANVTDLPASGTVGDTVAVGDVLFEYGADGVWREVAGYTMTTNQNGLSLLKAGKNLLLPASERKGTYQELKDLAGTHVPIYAAWWASRFVLVTTLGVWVSAVGSPLEVWPSSSVSPRPDDGYFLRLGSETDKVQAALLTSGGLIVVTLEGTFWVTLGSRQDARVNITRVGGAADHRVFLVQAAGGVIMVRQSPVGYVDFLTLTPSAEGGRITDQPILPQLDPGRIRGRIQSVTTNLRGDELYVHTEVGTDIRVWFDGSPRATRYTGVGAEWAGFIENELIFYRSTDRGWGVYEMKQTAYKDDNGSLSMDVQASITFHPPPQWRSYAPDGRYTLKQAACWTHVGDTEISCRGLTRRFSGQYPAALPIHQPGEHQVTFSSASDRWHLKACQYTLVVRNGKTPGAW